MERADSAKQRKMKKETMEIVNKLKLTTELKGMPKSEWKKRIKNVTTKAIPAMHKKVEQACKLERM